MNVDKLTYAQVHEPMYVMEEELLRRNLSLIQGVAKAADVEIILAFKAFALWKTFPIFREYIGATTASSLFEARLAFEEFGSPAHSYSVEPPDVQFALAIQSPSPCCAAGQSRHQFRIARES